MFEANLTKYGISFKHARVIGKLYSYLYDTIYLYKLSVAETNLIDHVGKLTSV